MAKRGRKSLEEQGLISEEIVRNLYETQSLSVSAAARKIGENGISSGAFKKYMAKYGIVSRSRGNRRSKEGAQDSPSVGSFETHVTGPDVGFESI